MMMRKYLKSFFQINHSFSHLKFFCTDSKLKYDDGKVKSRNFQLNDLFQEDISGPSINKRIKFDELQEEDQGVNNEETQENYQKPEKKKESFVNKENNEEYVKKENTNQFNSHINKIVKTNENSDTQKYKTNENTSNKSQQYNNKYNNNKPKNKEELIDEMLHNKNNTTTNLFSTYPNQNNKQINSTHTGNIMKRQKISFVREGMIVNFYLKKVNLLLNLVVCSWSFCEKRWLFIYRTSRIY